MGVITTGSFAKFLWPGVNSAYGMTYSEVPLQFPQIFEKNTSKRAYEQDVGLSGMGLAVIKPEGGSITYDEMEQGFVDTYTHVVIGLGFIITRETYEDLMGPTEGVKKAKSLAFSVRQAQETMGANILNRAFSNSYVYGDGVELCSTAHPNKSGGTWKNELTTAADLSEAAIEQACFDIADLANDRGLKISVKPEMLVVPPELQFEAERILKSQNQAGNANNDINAIKSTGVFPKGYYVYHYLTDADAWFIKTNCPNGMKYFERRGMEFATDNEFDTEAAKFKATWRGQWGCTDKRSIFGSPGAA